MSETVADKNAADSVALPGTRALAIAPFLGDDVGRSGVERVRRQPGMMSEFSGPGGIRLCCTAVPLLAGGSLFSREVAVEACSQHRDTAIGVTSSPIPNAVKSTEAASASITKELHMSQLRLGYKVSAEQFGPRELVEMARPQ